MPEASFASKTIGLDPIENKVPEGNPIVCFKVIAQLSVAVTVKVAVVAHAPVLSVLTISEGQNTEGGVVSRTVMIALQESKFLTESLTIKYTSLIPKLEQSNALLRTQILSNPQSSVELSLT